MAADRKLTIQIVGDSRSAEKAFKRVNQAATGFGSKLKSIGKLAAVGVGAAFIGLGLLLRKGFKEFMQANVVMAQTRAVLKSTGGAANVTARHVDRLASSLSRMSGIDDEVIAAGENMLLTFTNIRNGVGKDQKIFDQATRAILDLSVATGKDMTTSAIMVGKALNDLEVNSRGTITGWSALRRVGVMITADMMKQAAAFIQAGKPMKAQQLLLRELNTEFGGSAKAFGSTLPGAFAKFRNATDEVTGAFAEGLAPIVQRVANLIANKMANPAFVARVRELGRVVGQELFQAFRAISQWFQANWTQIQGGFRTFVAIMRTGVRVAGQLKSVLMTITTPLRIQLKILLAIWDKVLAAVSAGAGILSHVPGVGGKFAGVQQAADQFRGALKNPLGGGGGGKPKAPKMWEGTPTKPRARGGRVMRGAAYTVGEHGPETFSPATSGKISNGSGGPTHIHVHVGSHKVAEAIIGDIQRLGKRGASQQRGRLGGQNLALG